MPRCHARVTYRGELAEAVATLGEDGGMRVRLEPPLLIALQQTVALYDGEVCLGGGLISWRGASLYEERAGPLCFEKSSDGLADGARDAPSE